MRFQTKERAKLSRDWSPVRRAFVLSYGFCWACGLSDLSKLDCHEMAKGTPHREKAFTQVFCWFVACGDCNCGCLCDYSEWPLARQLALKKIFDPENFKLAAFNELRGRAPDAISLKEVNAWVRKERRRVG